MLNLEIAQDVLDAMIDHARTEVPIEACGILAGQAHSVQRLYTMTNTDTSNAHFMMEPAEQFKVAKEVRAAGQHVLAVYHSHPETPARPSAEDIRLALTPGIVHVIVSLQNPDHPVVRGFQIENGQAVEITVATAYVASKNKS
jgi:[CysO sulfur-carrier protein]-S-L-cysteine hydrolase